MNLRVRGANGLQGVGRLTKLVLGLDGVLGDDGRPAAHSVAGTDSEEIRRILLETGDAILWSISTAGSQRPGLALHVPPFHHVRNDLASSITLRFLPGQADLAISGIHHRQVFD